MGGAVGAIVAIDWLARFTIVCVSVKLPLGELEVLFRHNLVQRISSTPELLAGIAMAENVLSILELHLPLSLTAVTLSVIGRHDVGFM